MIAADMGVGAGGIISAWTYGLAAVAYAAGAILIIGLWRSGRSAWSLAAAFMLSALWAVWASYSSFDQARFGAVNYVLECLRYAGIYLLIGTAILDRPVLRSRPALLVAALWGVLLIVGTASFVDSNLAQRVSRVINLYSTAMIIFATFGLTLVETGYRNTSERGRWAVKYLWLGVAMLLIYDLYLFANFMLYGRLDFTSWSVRGLVNAAAVPLILVAVSRNSKFGTRILISRKVAFYSTSLLIAGSFLIFTAVGGYYVKNYAGTWGEFIQLVFLIGALTFFAAVMLSGQVRARISVFIAKHFYSHKYDYREKWLQLVTGLTSKEGLKPLASSGVNALAEIVQSPAGGIWVRSAGGAFMPSGGELAGESAPVIEADHPVVERLQETDWILELDSRRDTPGSIYEALPGWIKNSEELWLLVPVQGTQRLRAIVLLSQPRINYPLDWEDYDLLKVVARQIGSYLDLEVAAESLAEAMQFQAHSKLSAFIMHDLKNIIAQLSLMIQNATQHRDNPEFMDDVLATVENSVGRMRSLLETLASGESGGDERPCKIEALCKEAVSRRAGRRPVPTLTAADDELFALVNPEKFVTVLGHIIANAQDACGENGELGIAIESAGKEILVHVKDNGTGMDRDFIRDRLFRPFDSTKGTKGMGIGAFQARDYVRSVGGDVVVQSTPGSGTTFTLRIPALDASRQSRLPGKFA